jgi:hypothetical protein
VAPWAADPLPSGLPPAVAARRVGEPLFMIPVFGWLVLRSQRKAADQRL